jgi:formate C-acetyltransferase
MFKVGLKGIIEHAEQRLAEIDRDVPADYIDQKEFLQSVIIALGAVIKFANRYAEKARAMAEKTSDRELKKRLEEIAVSCEWVPENPPRSFLEALQFFFFIHVARYME